MTDPIDQALNPVSEANSTGPLNVLSLRRAGLLIDSASPRLKLALGQVSEFLSASDRITSRAPRLDAQLNPGVMYRVQTGLYAEDYASALSMNWRSTKEAWASGVKIERVDFSEDHELEFYITVITSVRQSSVAFWFEGYGAHRVVDDTAKNTAPRERLIGQPNPVDRLVKTLPVDMPQYQQPRAAAPAADIRSLLQ